MMLFKGDYRRKAAEFRHSADIEAAAATLLAGAGGSAELVEGDSDLRLSSHAEAKKALLYA